MRNSFVPSKDVELRYMYLLPAYILKLIVPICTIMFMHTTQSTMWFAIILTLAKLAITICYEWYSFPTREFPLECLMLALVLAPGLKKFIGS
jgi:hypothetical protein